MFCSSCNSLTRSPVSLLCRIFLTKVKLTRLKIFLSQMQDSRMSADIPVRFWRSCTSTTENSGFGTVQKSYSGSCVWYTMSSSG